MGQKISEKEMAEKFLTGKAVKEHIWCRSQLGGENCLIVLDGIPGCQRPPMDLTQILKKMAPGLF